MILIINTTDQKKVTIALVKFDGNLVSEKKIKVRLQHSEKLLPEIDNLLKEKKVGLNDLKGMIVVSGPGGFTSLRIGVMTANTLAFALKIPVVGVKLSEFKNLKDLIKVGLNKIKKTKPGAIVLPYYGREPHITKPKAKF